MLRTEILHEVLRGVVSEILDGGMVAEALTLAFDQLRSGHAQQIERRAQIERELLACDHRLSRLVEALVSGSPLETVVNQIKVEEARKKALAQELDSLHASGDAVRLDSKTIERELKGDTADVKAP